MSKAFDRVWHKGLIYKLEPCCITGQLRQEIKHYVTNGTHRVFINNSLSNQGTLTAGIPQGSVRRPFLFIVYVSDIADERNCVGRLFAGDNSLTAASNDN